MMPPDDEPVVMMRDSILICAAFWSGILALAFLPACTPTVEHQVTLPQADRIVDKIGQLKPPISCRKLDLPPVPTKVHLDIDGDKIAADEGGETLLRGFVACRSFYRDAPASTKPTTPQ